MNLQTVEVSIFLRNVRLGGQNFPKEQVSALMFVLSQKEYSHVDGVPEDKEPKQAPGPHPHSRNTQNCARKFTYNVFSLSLTPCKVSFSAHILQMEEVKAPKSERGNKLLRATWWATVRARIQTQISLTTKSCSHHFI